jgi:predicted RNA-binding Zn-ribbon protein involved in translation (DUF1610 family)
MEPEWLAYLRKMAPDLYEQARKEMEYNSVDSQVKGLREANAAWQTAFAELAARRTVGEPFFRGMSPGALNMVTISFNNYQLHNLHWLLTEITNDAEWCQAFNTGDWFGEVPALVAEKVTIPVQSNSERGTARARIQPLPIRMIINCPQCGTQHVDTGEWETKPHRSHLCANCGFRFKTSESFTVGVVKL